MRRSRAFIPTTKEAPSDATLASHIYLSRAGFISQVASGLYSYMPMAKKVITKIENVINQEMANAGCEEVELSFVTPITLWEESGRSEKFGKELLRFHDRKDNMFVLGPTHEEMMVDLVRNRVTSYKQLPINLYQMKIKFRDEARPRFGIMRGREFLMKDGYSFHSSVEDLDREFDAMERAYKKILARLGLDFRVVEADSGAIGGSGSKELMVIAGSGEDTLAVCDSCEYGANIEIFLGASDEAQKDIIFTSVKDIKGDEICPNCDGKLSLTKGIEVGHIFKLGTTYSAPLKAHYLDENGKAQPFIMGTYGMGVSRIMAAIIEQNHDESGCIWTKESAPYSVNIIISNIKDEAQVKLAEELYENLKSLNVEVMLDDTKERFGFKMKDAELIGFPYSVIIGKELENGVVQIFDRKTKEITPINAQDIKTKILELL
ncbi:proline--tRNA ligase [Sulfurimonas sp.]|uniref:proline--tRNA ligase n=1 Tax=Sulfurimonas sp. TaxID=2022749 RepID=UPI0025EEBD36|nr:proline--tRNA ligase [Sulfurimonas sp.]MDD5156778.1 proline--tRNA ligase [Sulfurimonas sp.]